MSRLHPWPGRRFPTVWLMTDARNRAGLAAAIAALPRDAGIVLRDGDLPREERRRLFRRVAALAARRRLPVLVAGAPIRGDWRAAGRHNSPRRDRPIRTRAVHDAAQAERARRAGVDGCFISPAFPTRSHPGARALGRWGWRRLAQLCPGRRVALGGMTAARYRRLKRLGADGWAAIGALMPAERC